jgi:hypothetical protein
MQPVRATPRRSVPRAEKLPPAGASPRHGQPLRIPISAATLEGFRAWAVSDEFPDAGRIAFIDQEIWIDMSPESLETHGLVRTEIGCVIANLIRRHKLGLYFPNRTLLTNTAAGLSAELDGAFALWKALRSRRVSLVPRVDNPEQSKEVRGTPTGCWRSSATAPCGRTPSSCRLSTTGPASPSTG